LTSPDFACDPNPELYSTAAMLSFNTVIIPNGFSPNGDGDNDEFSIPGLDQSPNFKMEVFDRWGNSVYKYNNNGSLSPDWWDGRSTGNMTLNKGDLVPAGTYFYLIDFNDGNKAPVKGWVYINY
jgi:gliding motility-associated-like protein